MRFLVTGAAGFIGSHLCDRLLAEGHEVVGVDNFHEFYDPAIKRRNLDGALAQKGFTLVQGDIRDEHLLDRAVDAVEVVVHLAAMAGVRPSLENPRLYQDVNVGGTVSLLQACRRRKVKNICFASSSSIYGNNTKVPFSEEDPVDRPISPYAASKKAAELMCHTWHALWDMDVVCLRYFTVYGPRQRPDLAIHKFFKMAIRGESIPFYGDGSMARDYTYIDDIIDGTVAAINSNPGSGFRIVNLGSDQPIRLDSLVAAISDALGVAIRRDVLPVPLGDVKMTWADLTRAKSELGYSPKVRLNQGLERFASWLRNEGRGE